MIGYEFLLSHVPLRMPPLGLLAQVRPVARIEAMPDLLAVLRHVVPADDTYEAPSPDQARACLQAMAPFRDRMPLTEGCLAALQNVVITNGLKLEQTFRGLKNWLQRGGHGALAVRYVPSLPAALGSLIDEKARHRMPPSP